MPQLVVSANTVGDYIGDNTNFIDTMLRGYTSYQNNNYGNVSFFEVSNWESGDLNHGVLKPDLSDLPAGCTIDSVELRLYCSSRESTNTLNLRRLLVSWEELESTWIIRSTGNNWNTAGATGDGTDRVATPIGAISSALGWMTLSGSALISFVQDVVDGVITNHGFHLQDNMEAYYHSHTIISAEGTDGYRPAFIVNYTEGGGVELAGTIPAVSSVSGSLLVEKLFAGTISAESTITGALLVQKLLSGIVRTISTVIGTLGGRNIIYDLGSFETSSTKELGTFERSEYYDLGEFVCLEES